VKLDLFKIRDVIIEKNPNLGGFNIEVIKSPEYDEIRVDYKVLNWGGFTDDDIHRICGEFMYCGFPSRMSSHYQDGKIVFMNILPKDTEILAETYY